MVFAQVVTFCKIFQVNPYTKKTGSVHIFFLLDSSVLVSLFALYYE